MPAADWQYWRQAARLALELLVRQRFIPALDEKTFHAVWRPVFNAPEDARRLELLARAMPPVCRAAGGVKRGSAPAKLVAPAPEMLVTDFVRSLAQNKISRLLAENPAVLPSRLRGRTSAGRDTPGRRWAATLLRGGGEVDLPPETLKIMAGELIAWRSPLFRSRKAAFHTCFRLEPPDAAMPEEAAGKGGKAASPDGCEDTWMLRYFLQSGDDPSLLVPAENIWQAGGTLHYLRRCFENPQERLLADLGQASRLFPVLERSLHTSCPTCCRLSTAEADQFLRQALPLFQESGLGVLAPAWWGSRGNRLGLRLKLKPARKAQKGQSEGVGTGLFGMHSLVEFDWELALGEQIVEPAEFRRLAAMKVPLVQVRGQWVQLQPEQLAAALRLLPDGQNREPLTLKEAWQLAAGLPVKKGLELEDLTVTGISAEGELQLLLERLHDNSKLGILPAPAGFQGRLRPYQSRGFSWLHFLAQVGMGGCLADDMGLGKTVQFLVFLLHRVEQGLSGGPVLLICPTSVAGNWQREAARFAPGLQVLVHHGPDRLRGADFVRAAATAQLVVTTYSLAQRDQRLLTGIDWDGVVLDEAQNIKNPAAKQTQSVKKLKAAFRFALTGTPVENRLSELWSIMDFLNPGFLGGGAAFNRRFAQPIERRRDSGQTKRLQQLIHPFILRRVKTDPKIIPDLPEKQESSVLCPLTREQATLYQAVVQDMLTRIEAAEGIERRGLVLATTTKLKQVCNHPAQFLGDGLHTAGRSGKMTRLLEMLEEVLASGEKALIFTQYARMGEILKNQLQTCFGREVLFLHGGVNMRRRDQMVERFQQKSGPPCFVISLKAGGVGLNLTRANHVFHFDRWWNPAVEDQATDRAFRIGQRHNVFVYKYVCSGTLEERIDQMIEEKKTLAAAIVTSAEEWLTELSTAELRELFTLRRQAVSDD
ncbi:hypothetical protein A6M21_13890 [Desulfotomaculum copahuensis]|uniref:Helicase SNF2 n=1 Tax=Desulfotomaculum copahuensis TaxID=1838280 RepID=A0A1B7LCA5_9FIRM|nr:hypothetical protein A6M21_13890 [Desulfotomaculum copahuensis]